MGFFLAGLLVLLLGGGAAGLWKRKPSFSASFERKGRIGDGLTSERDANLFFESLDSDADGAVEPGELADFFGKTIGGPVLDSSEEISAGVASMMGMADSDKDKQLSTAEMSVFWRRLGSLLSVEEVAAWVEHSVQLPKSVADKFRDASVSGYDFVELVYNSSALASIVEQPRHRMILVRAMRMRLTGVGKAPASPAPLLVDGDTCSKKIHLSWSVSDGAGFPTHKYRLERRASNEKTRGSRWVCVADDDSRDFVDQLPTASSYVTYEYRVAAWNAIGRSAYATKRYQRPIECDQRSSWTLPVYRAFTSLYVAIELGLSIIVVSLAILKLFASTEYPEIFATIWNSVYAVLDTPIGRSLVPAFFFEVSQSFLQTATPQYRTRPPGVADPKQVGTSGVRALPPEMDEDQVDDDDDHNASDQDDDLFGHSSSSAAAAAAITSSRRRRIAAFPRPMSMPDIYAQKSPTSLPNSKASDDELSSRPTANPRSEGVCHVCRRPFVYAIRSKHHCYLCARPFCRNCGRIAHSQFVTCPVGSRCVCDSCSPRLPKKLPPPSSSASTKRSASNLIRKLAGSPPPTTTTTRLTAKDEDDETKPKQPKPAQNSRRRILMRRSQTSNALPIAASVDDLEKDQATTGRVALK